MGSPATTSQPSAATRAAHDTPAAWPAPPAAAPSPARATIDELLLRIRGGSRDAAAEFLLRYGSRIRRRIRGKLGPDIRRLFDSLDILSTLGRRLDLYVMSGRLQVSDEGQLVNLLCTMADHALVDKARIFRSLQAGEGEDGEFARSFAARLRESAADQSGVEIEIENCMNSLDDPIDRQILSLWLTGEPHAAIGRLVDLTPTAVRKRWGAIKQRLKERFQAAVA